MCEYLTIPFLSLNIFAIVDVTPCCGLGHVIHTVVLISCTSAREPVEINPLACFQCISDFDFKLFKFSIRRLTRNPSAHGESQVRSRTSCHILATGRLHQRDWIIMGKSGNRGQQ